MKRAVVIALQVHLFMLMSSAMMNVLENMNPDGYYTIFSCRVAANDNQWDSTETTALISANPPCAATPPLAFLSAAAAFPFFRFFCYRQVRKCCFGHQHHWTQSEFPVNVRKFGYIAPRTAKEAAFSMKNKYEMNVDRVRSSRTSVHRLVEFLYHTTQARMYRIGFYSAPVSWCIVIGQAAFVISAGSYTLAYVAYFSDAVVFHWLASMWMQLIATTFVFEPLFIVLTE